MDRHSYTIFLVTKSSITMDFKLLKIWIIMALLFKNLFLLIFSTVNYIQNGVNQTLRLEINLLKFTVVLNLSNTFC